MKRSVFVAIAFSFLTLVAVRLTLLRDDSPGSGAYSNPQSVTVADTTTGVWLCYTTNGSTPAGTYNSCSTGTHYTGAFNVTTTSTVKVIGYKANYNASSEHDAAYTITGGSSSVTVVGTYAPAGFGSPYSFAPTQTIAAGHLAVLACTSQNSAAINFVVSDDLGSHNAWTYPTTSTNQTLEFADTGQTRLAAMAYSVLTYAIDTGHHVTLTPSTDNGFGCYLLDISSPQASPFDKCVSGETSYSQNLTSPSLTPVLGSGSASIGLALFSWNSAAFSSYGNVIGSASTGIGNQTQSAGNVEGMEYRRLTASTAGTAIINVAAGQTGTSLFCNFQGN